MRIAALYDIHANVFALQAALHAVRAEQVDLVVIGGDVLPGPMPRETLDCLLALEVPVRFIHGNGDRLVVTHLTGGDIGEVPESFRDMIYWTARQLSVEQWRVIERWPATHQCDMPDLGRVLFCHATPRNDTEVFTRLTAEERLIPVFANVDASVVVCGHTHIQFARTVAGRRVVNAGSVGMPYQSPPGAYWLLLGDDVQLRRTDYDFAAAAEAIVATGFPQAEVLVVRYVISPPTEEESLRMLAGAELA